MYCLEMGTPSEEHSGTQRMSRLFIPNTSSIFSWRVEMVDVNYPESCEYSVTLALSSARVGVGLTAVPIGPM